MTSSDLTKVAIRCIKDVLEGHDTLTIGHHLAAGLQTKSLGEQLASTPLPMAQALHE